jgi:2-haloacid dehalogenase
MSSVIAFDVNETLLDLRALDEKFERLLGSASLRAQWFAQMLQLAFVGGLTDHYIDFTTAQSAAVHMIAKRAGRALTDESAQTIVDSMSCLPPHPEVAEALARLSATPMAVVALTNSVQSVVEAQLRNARIAECFDKVISADSVRALKPAPAPYHAVADAFGTDIDNVRLVAAHAWDISGALAAGACAAFVSRPGMVLNPIGPQPDIVGPDIADVVDQIIRREAL